MTYATKADLVSAFGANEVLQLSDRDVTGVDDDALIGRALDDAAAEINGYLQTRYALPLSNVPRLLTVLACDITRFRLCGSGAQETEAIRLRYRDAVRTLESISKGTVSLGVDINNVAAAPTGTVRVSAPVRLFGSDTLGQY